MISTLLEKDTTNQQEIVNAQPSGSAKGLRICMLGYAFYESDTRIMQYARALAERGESVDVIALQRDPSFAAHEVLDDVNVYRVQARTVNERGLFAYGSRITRFLLRSMQFADKLHRSRPYDVIHVHNVPDFLVFAALGPKLRGASVVLDIHDLLPEFYASKFKISHDTLTFRVMVWFEKLSATFADHVIVANHVWRDRYAARTTKKSCSVVRNRPDLSIFKNLPKLRKSPEDPFLMMYPGSLNWHQGLDIAIRAFASVENELPNAEFHIYGEGSAKPDLIALAESLNQHNRVFFHDFLPSAEIAQIMARADLAIEPKRTKSAFSNEALSTKILEFMSLGVPIIACRTRIHAYYYDDSLIAYYEDDDEQQLARKMVELRHSPELRQILVENGKRHAMVNTWDACKGEYLELVDSLVAKAK